LIQHESDVGAISCWMRTLGWFPEKERTDEIRQREGKCRRQAFQELVYKSILDWLVEDRESFVVSHRDVCRAMVMEGLES